MNNDQEAGFDGTRIRLHRESMKLTQEELADQAGTSRQSIKEWEAGRMWPSLASLFKLAQIFGCQAGDLLPTSTADADLQPLAAKLSGLPPRRRNVFISLANQQVDELKKLLSAEDLIIETPHTSGPRAGLRVVGGKRTGSASHHRSERTKR